MALQCAYINREFGVGHLPSLCDDHARRPHAAFPLGSQALKQEMSCSSQQLVYPSAKRPWVSSLKPIATMHRPLHVARNGQTGLVSLVP